jgi:AAA15 family ATPase/GTPase
MLIEFSVTNFRSIRKKQTFSMESINKYKELPKNIAKIKNYSLLKAGAIYGKNASGKSNLILAFKAVKFLVQMSSTFKVNNKIRCYEPFELDEDGNSEPTTFELLFFGKNEIKYSYRFSYNEEKITEEQLIYYPKKQPKLLYNRDSEGNFELGEKIKAKTGDIIKNLFSNQLFLSKVGTEKIEELIEPYLFFDDYLYVNILNLSCSLCDKKILDMHSEMLYSNDNKYFEKNINKLLCLADTGITGIEIKENKEEDFSFPATMDKERKKRILEENRLQVFARHKKFENGNVVGEVKLDLGFESAGTNRLLAIGGLILGALSDGITLVVDEMERSLHPYLTRILIELFNNQKTNPHNAQLIFTTHDTSILTSDLFRRDQVWFTDKDEFGYTSFYSLGDIKGVRKDVPYHKYYLKGLFGGVPNVNFYDFNFNE